MLSGYTLAAARDGGYFVFDNPGPSDIGAIMFAGTLVECFAYLRGRFEPSDAGQRPDPPSPRLDHQSFGSALAQHGHKWITA